MKFFLFILIMILNSCSSLFWRESKLNPELSFSEKENSILYSRNSFLEKDSWNPMNGTTLKKGYSSILKIVELKSDLKLEYKNTSANLSTWYLPGSVKFNHSQNFSVLIAGKNSNEFGTELREIILIQFPKSTQINLSETLKLTNPIDLAISPLGNKILVLNKFDTNSYQINLISLNSANSINLTDTILLKDYSWKGDGDSEITWIANEVFIKGYNSCVSFNEQTKKVSTCDKNKDYKNSKQNVYSSKYTWDNSSLEIEEIQLKK